MIQLRIVCILHINNETDMNGNLMLLNLPYVSSSVPVDQIFPPQVILCLYLQHIKKNFPTILYPIDRSSDTSAFELHMIASGLCFVVSI